MDHGLVDKSELGDLPDRKVLSRVESFQVFSTLQTERGRKRDGTFDERGDRSAPVRLQVVRGS